MFDRASQIAVFVMLSLFLFPTFVGIVSLVGFWPQGLAFAATGAPAISYGIVRLLKRVVTRMSNQPPHERRRVLQWRLPMFLTFLVLPVPMRYGFSALFGAPPPEDAVSLLVPLGITGVLMLFIFPALLPKEPS